MSNYTKFTNFSTKDNLPAGSALKRVKGAEIDDEFNAISVAVATKANTNNTALTGTPTAPTASSGTSSVQIATTAFTTSAIAAIPAVTAALINGLSYPVGSIYTAVVSTNPATLLGVGTWAAFGAGRVLLGAGGGYSAGATGGATTDSHALTTAEMPAHTHTLGYEDNAWPNASGDVAENNLWNSIRAADEYRTTSSTGSGSAHTHDIMQPYIVVYMWKRTA